MQSAVRGMGEKTVAVQCSKAFKVRHKYKAILSTSNQNQLIHQTSFKSSIFFVLTKANFYTLFMKMNSLPLSRMVASGTTQQLCLSKVNNWSLIFVPVTTRFASIITYLFDCRFYEGKRKNPACLPSSLKCQHRAQQS